MGCSEATLNVVGTGGFARQILPLLRREAEHRSGNGRSVRFAADGAKAGAFEEFDLVSRSDLPTREEFVIAISDGALRQRLASELSEAGLKATRLISQHSLVSSDVNMAPGAIICDYAIIEPMVRIGVHFHANCFAFVAHECVIGDFVTFGPRATCNGNVHIGSGAYIGANATIRQGRPDKPLQIGEGATIGMGAVVLDDVEPGTTVVGNPARPLERS